MTEIDTSPATLRALAASLVTPQHGETATVHFKALSMVTVVSILRAIAAEKEAATKSHDPNRAGIAQATAMARNDIRRAFDRDEITAEDYRRMNDELDRNAGIVRADPKPPMSAAEKEAATVKPDLTVGEEVTPLKAVAVMGVRPPLAQESSPIISTTVDLRTLAGAATPGPWQVVTYRTPFSITRHDGTTCSGEHVGRDIATVRHHPQSHAPYPIVTLGIGVTQETPVHFVFIRPEDADYLAAVSPEVVLALLDTIDALRASLAAAEKERDALRLAILGGEDAPGYATTVSIP